MSYPLPAFNLVCNVWRGTADPAWVKPTGPPDLSALPCQLWYGKSTASANTPFGFQPACPLLLVPKGTDVRGHGAPVQVDTVECPAGTGRFYRVMYVEDRARGFSNEHRCAALYQLVAFAGGWLWPTP